jgi:hypothetical protein
VKLCYVVTRSNTTLTAASQEFFKRFHPRIVRSSWCEVSVLSAPLTRSTAVRAAGAICAQCRRHLRHFPEVLSFKNFVPCIACSRFCPSYKLTVPTFGCALIDPTRSSVLLVKGFGRNRSERPSCVSWYPPLICLMNAFSSWGFPKGKLSRNESEMECAVR